MACNIVSKQRQSTAIIARSPIDVTAAKSQLQWHKLSDGCRSRMLLWRERDVTSKDVDVLDASVIATDLFKTPMVALPRR